MKDYIQFINHASVVISNGNKSILTDPWYSGGAFDNGWELIYKNENIKIKDILKKLIIFGFLMNILIIFSIQFFKDYYDFIKEKKN